MREKKIRKTLVKPMFSLKHQSLKGLLSSRVMAFEDKIEEFLWRANVKTKESLEKAIESVYANELSMIEQAFVGSHAANFAPDGPERTGKFKEEFYVKNMVYVREMAQKLLSSKRFKTIFLFEPGLVNTAMAHKAFTEERIGYKVDWANIDTPEKYAEIIFPEEFFTARQ